MARTRQVWAVYTSGYDGGNIHVSYVIDPEKYRIGTVECIFCIEFGGQFTCQTMDDHIHDAFRSLGHLSDGLEFGIFDVESETPHQAMAEIEMFLNSQVS